MSRYVPTGATTTGGLGAVAIYRDSNLDRKVAIKFVLPGGEHRRHLDELAALQRIRSKNVVQVFDVDFFDPGARMGIVEEFIDGDSLKDLLGKVTVKNGFLKLLYQAATGIADIHRVGVVHRDIKPSNMLIDRDGVLKIIDFNLSRSDDEARTVGFVGTLGYAAPELHSSGAVEFSAAADVYALGVTAWALLHGKTLPKDLLTKPPRPDLWTAASGGFSALSLDPTLARLLDACLDVSPLSRPTATQVAERASRVLLRNRHRALFIGAEKPFELNAGNPRVRLRHPTLGGLAVEYDGLDFRATEVSGEVWMNNIELAVGATMSGCCVVALGAPARRASERTFITMDVSHPEVVL